MKNPLFQIPFPATGGAWRVQNGQLKPDGSSIAEPEKAKEPAIEPDSENPPKRIKRNPSSEQE